MTRWWWFAKLFGTNSWTANCPQCHSRCAVHVPREFSRATKFWTVAACGGIYLAVFGTIILGMQGPRDAPPYRNPGFYAGAAGIVVFFFSLTAALVTDVLQSQVVLTAATVCPGCGERLPRDFADDVCPVCGGELPRDIVDFD